MMFQQGLRQGVAWLFAGNTGNQALAFVFGIVLARILTPEVFGMLVVIQIYTGLVSLVSSGGMGQALVRAPVADEHHYNAVFTVQLCIGALIYCGFFFIAPAFANWQGDPLYRDLLRVAAVSFLLRPFVNLASNILHRQMSFKPLAGVNVATLILSSAVSIVMALLGYGVWSLIVGGLAGSLAGAAMLMPLARWRPRLTLDWSCVRELARYGMLTSVGDLIVYFRSQVAHFVLSRTLGAHAVGLFNKASSLSFMPNVLIAGSVYQVNFRALAKEQTNIEASRYLYLRSVMLVAAYSWPLFLSLAWLAGPLVRLLYGSKWSEAAAPLTCLAIVGPLVMLEILAGCVLAARNWLEREIPVQVVQTVVLTLGVLAGLPHGLLGVAIGVSVANVYGAAHLTWLATRCLSLGIGRVASALAIPALLNGGVLMLWTVIDFLLPPSLRANDLLYSAIILATGALMFLSLFLIAPLGDLASERARWLRFLHRAAA